MAKKVKGGDGDGISLNALASAVADKVADKVESNARRRNPDGDDGDRLSDEQRAVLIQAWGDGRLSDSDMNALDPDCEITADDLDDDN